MDRSVNKPMFLGRKERTMRLDDNQEAVNVERNLIHSLNNRLRQIYNLGYRKGYEDGTRTVTEEIIAKIVGEVGSDTQCD